MIKIVRYFLFVWIALCGAMHAQNNNFIGQASIGTGLTITTTGVYTVTEDIVFNAAGPAISIETDDVTLDLNGFHITGGTSAGIAIRVGAGVVSHKNITIKNGAITGFEAGINLLLPNTVTVENIVVNCRQVVGVTTTGLLCDTVLNGVLRNCRFNNGVIGAQFTDCIGFLIDDCDFSNNTADSTVTAVRGLHIITSNAFVVNNCSMNNNIVTAASGDVRGLHLDTCSSCKFVNCNFNANIKTGGTSGGSSFGASLSQGGSHEILNCSFLGNTVIATGGTPTAHGMIVTGTGHLISDCHFSSNTATGVAAAVSYGIDFAGGSKNEIVNCVADANGVGSEGTVFGFLITSGAYNSFSGCKAIGNLAATASFGFLSDATSFSNTFKNCNAYASGTGFGDSTSIGVNTFTGCLSSLNTTANFSAAIRFGTWDVTANTYTNSLGGSGATAISIPFDLDNTEVTI